MYGLYCITMLWYTVYNIRKIGAGKRKRKEENIFILNIFLFYLDVLLNIFALCNPEAFPCFLRIVSLSLKNFSKIFISLFRTI